MCLLLREALTVGKIAYHRNFLSVELNGPEAKKALQDEMLNYCVVTEAAKTTFGKGAPLRNPPTTPRGRSTTPRRRTRPHTP
jgi:hypothetical protein